MADDWDAFGSSRDGDGFPGSSRDDDGFPADGNDVFGANVENVDVWGGHDSFDGDQEWFNFNGDDDDLDQDEEHQNDSDPDSLGNSDRRRRGSRSSNRDGDHRRRSSSRDRSQDRSGGSRRRSSSRDRSGDGHRRHDDAKRGRRPKPLKNDPTRSSSGRKPSSKNKDGGGDGVDENGFPAFDDSDRHDGSRSQKLRASKGGSSRRHLGGVQTDDALDSSYTSSSRRQSGATGSRTLIRRRDGTVTRPRASESGSRNSRSGERRDKVRDALFGAIGDEGNQKGGVSLGNFLKDEKGGKPPRSSSDSRSVHSAPAVVSKGHRRHGGGSDRRSGGSGGGSHHSRGSHHDRDGSSHHGSPNKRDSRGHKNRRWSNRMGPPPEEEAESPQKAVEGAMQGLKVDIAALAEAGCIEVQDGKMRLVIDLDA